jgi:glycolate oxidase FAD binding subunit
MLDSLRKRLGPDRLNVEDAPAAVAGVAPIGLVAPRNVEEIAEVVRWCASEDIPLEPAGGCTWLGSGKRPERAPLVLSVRKLDEVSEYEPADLVATVQAGVTLDKLQRVTGAKRQRLALDAPADDGATVGALIATASAGPQRYGYGTARDHVLGLQVVTGDGRIANVGGKVVKNVAGYDLTRLLVGSRGSLGIITAAHIRLRPVPQFDVTFDMRAEAFGLIELAHACRSAAFEPVALELLVRTDEPSSLYIRVQGNEGVIAAAEYELQAAAGSMKWTRLDDKASSDAWEQLNKRAAVAHFSARFAGLPTEAVRIMRLAERVRACFPDGVLVLHAGSGIARVHASQPAVSLSALAEALQTARAELTLVRGSVIVPVAPTDLHERFECFPSPDGELRLMQELKRKFDPARILAPGRFVV